MLEKNGYEDLIQFLNTIKSEIDFNEETDLWNGGIFDSLDLVQIITGIEEKFGIHFDEKTLIPETFYSAKSIWKVISGEEYGNY